jgi:hypothetical protein
MVSRETLIEPATPVQVGLNLVYPSQKANNLGVVIESSLSMSTQIRETCKAAQFQLSRINKICRFLDFSTAKCIVNALVLSRIDYCISLYLGLHEELPKRLQRVQNASARTIFSLNKHDPISKYRKALHWNRAKFRVACLFFRCLNGSALTYLSNLLTPYSPARDLRSGEKNLLVTKPYRLIQYGK